MAPSTLSPTPEDSFLFLCLPTFLELELAEEASAVELEEGASAAGVAE